MPVIDNITEGYVSHDYIPSVKAIVDWCGHNFVSATNAAATINNMNLDDTETECFIRKIAFGQTETKYYWNENELVITHNLMSQFPNVQIFISESIDDTKYKHVELSWYVNDGDANNVYIDCSNYTDKLITVKITK